MHSNWWSLLPIALFALFYLIFLRVMSARATRHRRERNVLLENLRKRVQADHPAGAAPGEILCAGLPGTAVCVAEIREHHATRIAMKADTNKPGFRDARAMLEEMEIALPALARDMSRHGVGFARMENIGEKIELEARDIGVAAAGAYILRLPGANRFALAIVRELRYLPDLDQLSNFVEFLMELLARQADQDSREVEAATPELNDERANRLERENHRLRDELRARDNSLARIMHDIRLPLSGLMLNHELMEKQIASASLSASGTAPRDELTRALRLMKNQLNSLESFTHDVLQLETGHWLGTGTESTGEIDPDRVITRVLENFQESLRVKVVNVHFEPGEIGPVRIAETALERILYNLFSNSIKFCSSPGRLDIVCRKQDRFLTIEIEDSGPGLPGSHETLFELARRNIGRSGRGWGLGLASAMDLAEKLGGKLVVIPPKIAAGANFLLVLPV